VLIAIVCTTKIVLSLAFIVFFFLFNGLPSEGAHLLFFSFSFFFFFFLFNGLPSEGAHLRYWCTKEFALLVPKNLLAGTKGQILTPVGAAVGLLGCDGTRPQALQAWIWVLFVMYTLTEIAYHMSLYLSGNIQVSP